MRGERGKERKKKREEGKREGGRKRKAGRKGKSERETGGNYYRTRPLSLQMCNMESTEPEIGKQYLFYS